MTDNTGNVVQESIFTPFGSELLNAYNNGGKYSYRYATHEYMNEKTGLQYMQARWMMPELGRFISPDPAQQGINYYIYSLNNPTTMVDPDGLNAITDYISSKWSRMFGNDTSNLKGANYYYGSMGSGFQNYNQNVQTLSIPQAISSGSNSIDATAYKDKPVSLDFLRSGIQNRSLKDIGMYAGLKFAEMLNANHQSWAKGNILGRIGEGLLSRHAQDLNLASNIFLSTNPLTSSFMTNKNFADFNFNLFSQAKFANEYPIEYIDSQVTGLMKTVHQEASCFSQSAAPGIIYDAYTPEETGALIYEKGQDLVGAALAIFGEYAVGKAASVGSQIGVLDDILFKTNYVDDALWQASDNVFNVSGKSAADPNFKSLSNYKRTFFTNHPELKGKVVVHHGIEQQILWRPETQGLFNEAEIHAYDNLRGIPLEYNSKIHLSEIRKEWNRFYRNNPNPTRQQLLQKRLEIDIKYGEYFNPKKIIKE